MAMDKRIKCGVVESPFANLREIVHDYFAVEFHLRINSIPDAALKYSEKIAKFNVDSIQPALSAKDITQPVLVIHGLSDENISWKYGKEIYDNLKSKDKMWYPIPNGTHFNLSKVGGQKLKMLILQYFKKYI